jgi:hypothetical protein
MGEDAAAIRGVAVCGACGSDLFKLWIYSCGNERAHCSGCGVAWEAEWQEALWQASDRRQGQDIPGDEAVGQDGYEPGDVVQQAKGE